MKRNMEKDEKGKVNMCKALEDLKQEGFEEGVSQGISQGIEVFILDNLEEGISEEKIVQKLQRRFSLDIKGAQKFLDKYSDTKKQEYIV